MPLIANDGKKPVFIEAEYVDAADCHGLPRIATDGKKPVFIEAEDVDALCLPLCLPLLAADDHR